MKESSFRPCGTGAVVVVVAVQECLKTTKAQFGRSLSFKDLHIPRKPAGELVQVLENASYYCVVLDQRRLLPPQTTFPYKS